MATNRIVTNLGFKIIWRYYFLFKMNLHKQQKEKRKTTLNGNIGKIELTNKIFFPFFFFKF